MPLRHQQCQQLLRSGLQGEWQDLHVLRYATADRWRVVLPDQPGQFARHSEAQHPVKFGFEAYAGLFADRKASAWGQACLGFCAEASIKLLKVAGPLPLAQERRWAQPVWLAG